MTRMLRSILTGAAVAAIWPFASASAQQGAIAGRVTDQANGAPVAGARVVILGTNLVVQTNRDGGYVLARVRAGTAIVRASAIGYGAAVDTVTVAAGDTARADLALTLSAFTLDAIVTTATGDQERKELGNSLAQIRAADLVPFAPIANMSDLLVGKAPGVQVLPGNMTGAESRVRIRGTNSISLANDPIYYIDGIRMESSPGSSSIGVGGTLPSRVMDLNPEDIESVDIVRGPSAATLYGTDAANGVVLIRTKRGRVGAPRWSFYSELGILSDRNAYPQAYRGWTTGSLPTNGTQCFLTARAAGTCAQDSITTFNLFEDADATPLGTGWRGQAGTQLSGGSEAVQYFVSTEYEEEIGVLRMPNFSYGRILSARGVAEVPYEQYRPNALDRVSVRANVRAAPNPKLDLAVSTGFITSSLRLPQTDNNTTGLMSSALGGPGHKNNFRPGTGVQLYGYRAFTPDEFFPNQTTQDINRFIGSATAHWRMTPWLSGRFVSGVDFTSRTDEELCRRGECNPATFGIVNFLEGFKEANRTTFHTYTADGSLSATYALSPSVTAKTTAGTQYYHNLFTRNGAFGFPLPPGATTVTAGATQLADEASTASKTLGAFLEQQVGFNGRLFVTAAVRMDDNTAFGKDFSAVVYPKLSASWVVDQEPFFRAPAWLSSLRVRGAYGAAGQQPGSTDAVPFFTPQTANVDGQDTPAIVFSALGNVDLKPERAVEVEAGFDAGFLGSRINVDFTYYHKRTRDALISRPVAPSVGAAAARFVNLGSVRNSGVELDVTGIIVNRPGVGWDIRLGLAHNRNVLEDLGKDASGVDVPPIVGTAVQQREGYPLDSYWARPILGYHDLDGNGILTVNEIVVGDSAAFVGPEVPKTEITLATGVDLFNRRLRISGLLDYKGGKTVWNDTERIRCESRLNCQALIDPSAPLWDQARQVARREHPSRTLWGYFERADFLRLREVAVTYQLPQSWARVLSMANASVTLAGRNLTRWSGYSGMDPETGYFNGGDFQNDFQSAPPPSYWTLKVNLGF